MNIPDMKIKIDPDNYPIIIILAFVVGFILAMAFGFRPEHGSRESLRSLIIPAVVQVLEWNRA